MFQYTLIKHCCLPTQHSWVPATVPSQRASPPLSVFASNYCPLQVKPQSRRTLRAAERAAGGSRRARSSPGPLLEKDPTFVGFDSLPRGLGRVSLRRARSGKSWHQAGHGALLRLSPAPLSTLARRAEDRTRSATQTTCCFLSPLLSIRLREASYAKPDLSPGLPRRKARPQHQIGPGGCRRSGSRPAPPSRATFPRHNFSLPLSRPQANLPGSQADWGVGYEGAARQKPLLSSLPTAPAPRSLPQRDDFCFWGDSGNFGHRPVPLPQPRSAVPPHVWAPLPR